MTFDEMLEAFGDFESLPVDAIEAALGDWNGYAPRFLTLLHRYVHDEDASERTERALYVIIHLFAEKAETAAFKDLCLLGEQDGKLDSVYGPTGFAYSYASSLVSTFDGDPAPLHHLVDSEEASDYTRCEALLVLAYLACTRRIGEEQIYGFLSELAGRLPDWDHELWYGYARSVAALGFAGLSGVVDRAYKEEFILDPNFTSVDFWRELRLTQSAGRDMSGSEWSTLHPISSALDQLRMLDESPGRLSGGLGVTDDDLEAVASYVAQEPVRNPLRSVGRNDPCPCGSGKKYKKCCLGA